MNVNKSQEKIQLMRQGETIECPFCKVGKWSAKGDPKTTPVFGCDNCGRSMILKIAQLPVSK